MTLVHNEYDEICPVCNHPLGEEELAAGVDIHNECYWRVMDEYDEEMKKEDSKIPS